MARKGTLSGGVLATVLVAGTLMLLLLLGVIWLWEADFLLFSRSNHTRIQRAGLESAFVLYCTHPDIAGGGEYLLYDSLPSSLVKISRTPWGLYEAVSVTNADGRMHSTRMMAAREAARDCGNFWYKDNNGSLTLTGRTNLLGKSYLPCNGAVYGQMQSVFFSGRELDPADIRHSAPDMPAPTPEATTTIDSLMNASGGRLFADSLRVSFYDTPALVAQLGSGTISGCDFSGKVILRGERLHIDASCRLSHVVVVGKSLSVGDGFRGTVQLFASDTVLVGKNVVLEYPSGVYAERYAELGDGSELNGYMIVKCSPETDLQNPNLRKSRTSKLRGLLYVDGIAVLQGIVTGAAVIGESVYHSPQGYYHHLLFDATVLDSPQVGYPFWLDAPPRRKEAAWVE